MQNYQNKRLKQITKTAGKSESRKRIKPFSMSFTTKKSKKPRVVNLYLLINLNGKRDSFSVGMSCKSNLWDSKSQQIIGEKDKNKLLQNLKSEIERVYSNLILTERPVTFAILKGVAIGILNFKDSNPTFASLLDKEIEDYEKLYQKGLRSKGVLKHIKQWVRHIKNFLLVKYNNPNYEVQNLKPIFAKDLTNYILVDLGLTENSVRKIVTFSKKVLNDAVDAEYIDRNPIANHAKFKRMISPIIYLTENEITAIQQYPHFTEDLQRVADCFLFCASTGLSYFDARSLTPQFIKATQDGLAIVKPRAKTGQTQIIWLNPEAKNLLEKYKTYPYCIENGVCMPFISNQRMNQYLKAIGGILGFSKRLTTHVARKTYATFFANHGATEFTLKTLMGHSNIGVTQQYYIGANESKTIQNQKSVYEQAKASQTA
jgi:integrase